MLRTVRRSVKIILPKSRFKVLTEDPKDDVILNTVYNGNSEYIVSGGNDLLKLNKFKGIKIVKPKQITNIISVSFPELVFRF